LVAKRQEKRGRIDLLSGKAARRERKGSIKSRKKGRSSTYKHDSLKEWLPATTSRRLRGEKKREEMLLKRAERKEESKITKHPVAKKRGDPYYMSKMRDRSSS